MIKNKKAQEEIVGFMLIVVIMVIVLVIFLGLIIRKNSNNETESKEIHQFLESLMKYTTDCALSYVPDYSNLGSLIKECKTTSICTSGKDPCEIANDTIAEILESSFIVSKESSIKGYEFSSIYSINKTQFGEEILKISKGSCNGSIKGSDLPSPAYQGTISNSLRLCY